MGLKPDRNSRFSALNPCFSALNSVFSSVLSVPSVFKAFAFLCALRVFAVNPRLYGHSPPASTLKKSITSWSSGKTPLLLKSMSLHTAQSPPLRTLRNSMTS